VEMNRAVLVLAVFTALFACALSSDLATTTFSLKARVEKGEWEQSLADLEDLLAYAKGKSMRPNTILLLRTGVEKVKDSLAQEAEKKDKAEAAKKKAEEAPGPSTFTDKLVGVKPLKPAMSVKARNCNVPRYKAKEVAGLLAKKKINLDKPFLVTDGIHKFDELQADWNFGRLINNTELELRYLSPVVAKKKRSFDQPQQQTPSDEEQLEYSMIPFEKYFKNCFNHKAKPDFRKIPGSETEHCEQTIPAKSLNPRVSEYSLPTLEPHLGWLQKLEAGKEEFADKAGDFVGFTPDNVNIKDHLTKSAANSRFYVIGPAGSGEVLRQEGRNFVDALVHGKRRWFFMQPEPFMKLRETAKDVLEAVSAFMFMEQQFGELKEDYGLGGKGMEYLECNQEAGDLMFVPGNLIMTSLSLEDSFSYKQHVAASKDEVLRAVNSQIWMPESGQVPAGYQASACHGFDFTKLQQLGGAQLNAMNAQVIQQILRQYYPSTKAQNLLILNVLEECAGVLAAPELNPEKTLCNYVWTDCASQLEKNAKELKLTYPSWLPKKPTVKSKKAKTEL